MEQQNIILMSTELNNTQENTEQVVVDVDPAVSLLMETMAGTEQSSDTSNSDTNTIPDENSSAGEQNQETTIETGEETTAEKTETADDKKTDFDLNKFFEQSSEGLIKSEEDFKAFVSKSKEHETIRQKMEALEAEKETIFANESIKVQNRLIKEGKTDEQIANYMSLAKMDISSLDPKEVLIQREIKNGHTRALAERVVERKYGIDKLSFDEEVLSSSELENNNKELELANAMMKVDAEPVRAEMQTEFEALKNEPSASEIALQKAAAEKAYRTKLEPFAEKIQADFPKKLTIGDESTGILSYDVNEEFLSSIKEDAKDYFMDREVSPESVEEFMTVKKAIWAYNNLKEIVSHFASQGEVRGEKKVRDEFENNQGLPKPGTLPVTQLDNIDDALMSIAKS